MKFAPYFPSCLHFHRRALQEKLTSTETFRRKVCASSEKEIGPCLFSVTGPSGGMIHICIVSTVNWFQLKIKWEISLLLPNRKSEKKNVRRLLNVNTNTSVVKNNSQICVWVKKEKVMGLYYVQGNKSCRLKRTAMSSQTKVSFSCCGIYCSLGVSSSGCVTCFEDTVLASCSDGWQQSVGKKTLFCPIQSLFRLILPLYIFACQYVFPGASNSELNHVHLSAHIPTVHLKTVPGAIS